MRKIIWLERREGGNRRCMYCGGCVAVCPVGALKIKENKVVCNPNKCIECRDCTAVCPEGMLVLR